jgi:ribonuclease BN (tRNA processing enzyme)
MRLRTVGSSPSVPRPGRACSCYLVRTREAAVIFDLGSGALGNLQLTIDYSQIDAVVVSHMHADHFIDVIPLRYGLTYAPLRRKDRMPIWLPPGGSAILRKLCSVFVREGRGDFLDEVFTLREYDPSEPLEINDLRLTFSPTVHYIEAYSIRGVCGASSVTYSGDTAPCASVVEHARGCSLFLCEATLGLATEEGERGHSSAREAGEMARKAGVHRLALTHYGSAHAPGELVDAARSTFAGPVAVVDDGVDLSV